MSTSLIEENLSAPFNPTQNAPWITIAGANQGLDCFQKVHALMDLRPTYRAVIGSVMVWCRDDLQLSKPSYWMRPWPIHCWCIDDEGRIVDPAFRNLQFWEKASNVRLPDDLTAASFPMIKDSDRLLVDATYLVHSWPLNETPQCPKVIYAPGVLWHSPNETKASLSLWELKYWSKTSRTTTAYGGVALCQLVWLLDQVNKELEPRGFGN